MQESQLVVVGKLPDEVARGVQEAAASSGLTASFVTQVEAVEEHEVPAAVVVAMGAPGAVDVCATLREQTRYAAVPLLGLTAQRHDMAFIELFALGGDDLVSPRSPEPLKRRLRGLAGRAPQSTGSAGRAGVAIVASPDARWRSAVGRALYGDGYSVRFVTSSVELVEEAVAPSVALVVVADDLEPEGAAAACTRARAAGSQAAWVLASPPRRLPQVEAELATLSRAGVVDSAAPPDNVLFRANELASRAGPDLRAAPRLLYGTAVSFRGAGRDEDDVGFSYNVSTSGVYVRTLAPLEAGQEVWLDMWPPRSQRRVRLAGTVMWRRTFGAPGRATVPPGFGVKLVDGLAGDLERWSAGCEAFAG